jgi:phage-related holin
MKAMVLRYLPQLKAVAFSILALLTPIKAALIAVMVLTVIDLVSGLLAARHRKEPITSNGLKRTMIKLFVYQLVIIMAFIVQQYLTGEMIPVIKILAGYVGIVELKSVLENIEEVTGMPIIKVLIDKLVSMGNTPQ